MKDFALTNTNTHHAGRVHMRFVAALAFSLAASELSSVENVFTTDKFDASSETWNAGWFAVVAQNTGGATIIFR